MKPNDITLELAKVIGQPIDSAHPVSIDLAEIADVDYVGFGERVYVFDYDENTDTVYTAADNGQVTANKKSPSGSTELTFGGLQSELSYVTLNELQDADDNTPLARKKASISRSMDKKELKNVCDAILALDGDTGEADLEVAAETGDDVWTLIQKMINQVTDYADNFVLLAGSNVVDAINAYDRANADSFSMPMKIYPDLLDKNKVTVVKVLGTIATDSGESLAVLNADKAILVGRNSKIVGIGGKPVLFVRRRINPEVAKAMGIEPDAAQRLITNLGGLQVVSTSNILGYGVVGIEWVVEAITRYKDICFADFASII